MPKLGVNIDHVATLRQARREFDPDPVAAALICEKAGADSIVAHLREDRRHINDNDIRRLKKTIQGRLNLEMSLNPLIVQIAASIKPDIATLVPEKRAEITTEGGLDVVKNFRRIKNTNAILSDNGIGVSLFIDPVKKQIEMTKYAGINIIELHTGAYDRATNKETRQQKLKKIKQMTAFAHKLKIQVNAGHGLKYHNTRAIARIKGIDELNIGHSIITRAVFIGLEKAVREMITIIHR